MSKIVLVGPAHPYRGGISDFNEAFASELQKNGHDVTIISFKLQYPSFLFPGKTQYRVEKNTNFSFQILNLINSINPLTWAKTCKEIIKLNPDKVFIRFWMPFFAPCFGYISKKLRNKNYHVCGIVDNAIPHEKRIGDIKLVRYFLKQCDHIYTLSNKVSNEIKTISSDFKVTSLFHPVYNIYSEKPGRKEALSTLGLDDSDYILFFGLIRKYKGLDLAIEAMSHPKLKDRKLKLLIAGEFYDDKNGYLQLIKELKLNNIIIHDKFIPNHKVSSYFEVADLVLLPYITASQSGITQLAIHYQKPMLVNNVGGLPEVVKHNNDGFISEPNSSEIAKHILNFYDNDLLRKKIENAAKIKADQFSWLEFINMVLQK
jgi:glycosyltransferase involved in cell wall biosynthesis